MGCGINDRIVKSRAQMAITLRKVPDEEEKKNPLQINPLLVAIPFSWSTHTNYKEGLLILAVKQTTGNVRSSFLEKLSSLGNLSASSAGVVDILQQELDRRSNVFTN